MIDIRVTLGPGRSVRLELPDGVTREEVAFFEELWAIYRRRILRPEPDLAVQPVTGALTLQPAAVGPDDPDPFQAARDHREAMAEDERTKVQPEPNPAKPKPGTPEFKAMMSARLKEHWAKKKAAEEPAPKPEPKRKQSFKGREYKPHSEETKQKMRDAHAKRIAERTAATDLQPDPPPPIPGPTPDPPATEVAVDREKFVAQPPALSPAVQFKKAQLESEPYVDPEHCSVRWIVAFKAVCLRAELCTLERIAEVLNAEDPWLRATPGQVAAILKGRSEDVQMLEAAMAEGNEAFQREKVEVQDRLRKASTDDKVTFFGRAA